VARLAIDHNFNARITAGLVRLLPGLDVLRIGDAGLADAPDPDVLAWAAEAGRVLLTHDRATLVGFAYERVVRGDSMSGVIAVSARCPIGHAIGDLALLLECIRDDEWDGQVFFVPI
jgi:hypothetical protein